MRSVTELEIGCLICGQRGAMDEGLCAVCARVRQAVLRPLPQATCPGCGLQMVFADAVVPVTARDAAAWRAAGIGDRNDMVFFAGYGFTPADVPVLLKRVPGTVAPGERVPDATLDTLHEMIRWVAEEVLN